MDHDSNSSGHTKSKDLTRATASPSGAIEFKFIASPAAAPPWLAAGLELAEPC
jgi:hypothetical protein